MFAASAIEVKPIPILFRHGGQLSIPLSVLLFWTQFLVLFIWHDWDHTETLGDTFVCAGGVRRNRQSDPVRICSSTARGPSNRVFIGSSTFYSRFKESSEISGRVSVVESRENCNNSIGVPCAAEPDSVLPKKCISGRRTHPKTEPGLNWWWSPSNDGTSDNRV